MSHPDNGQFFKNCTFNSFLRLLGPQIVPPTAPDWFESISRVQCKSRIKSWDDDVTTWSLKDHVVTLCLRTISVRSKSECIQKLIKHLYFVHLFRYPAKKGKMLKKIQFFANDVRVWHLQFKWLLETGEAKTCKLDQYAYRSCWDISLRDFNQKLMEVKPAKSQI